MESNEQEAVFDASEAQERAVSRVSYEPQIYLVDPNTLLSHPASLEIYQDQDDQTIAADKNFMMAVRKHGGNLTPVLVWAKDRRTILSGDRRRTACKLLHLAVRVQYVDPGDIPGDIEQFIVDANQGARGTLDNFQKGRAAIQLREALRMRKDYFDAIEAAKQKPEAPALASSTEEPETKLNVELRSDSGIQVQADTQVAAASVATIQTQEDPLQGQADPVAEEPEVEARYDTSFDEVIAEKMSIPASAVKAAAKTVNRIDELESQGKKEEAEDLKQKLNSSLHITARTLPDRKRYEKGSAAAVKELERVIRGAIKTEVPNLLKVASCDPEKREKVINGVKAVYADIQELLEKEKQSKRPKKKDSQDDSVASDAGTAGDSQSADQQHDDVGTAVGAVE